MCLKLYDCIQSPSHYIKAVKNQTDPESSPALKLRKIDALEEFVENVLLVLGGVGAMAFLKQLVRFPNELMYLFSSGGRLMLRMAEEIRQKVSKSKL